MKILLETDLEPDDIVALLALKQIDYVVVGEGDAKIKYNRIKRYMQLLGKNPQIIQGIPSDKKFLKDGLEFDNLEEDAGNENYLEMFQEFAQDPNPILFSIKPMRELLREYLLDPILVKKLVANVALYAYGGFNFRCLQSHSRELVELLGAFKCVSIYESYYAMGANNSLNKNTSSGLYQLIMESTHPFILALRKLTLLWNTSLLDEAKRSLENNLTSEAKMRRTKLIENITGHETFQYVIADFALTAIYDKIEVLPVSNLHFDAYTKFDETTEPTNIYVYRNIPLNVIIDKYIGYVKALKMGNFSRYLTTLLRHRAIEKGYKMDDKGFVAVSEIMQKNEIGLEEIKKIVAEDSKSRFELIERPDGTFIRAVQGHSINLLKPELILCKAEDIKVVVHGTYYKPYQKIKIEGLSKMTRTHIHFAHGTPDDPTVISGMRANANVWIYIDVTKAMNAGIKFYKSANGVILSEGINGFIAPEYFLKVEMKKREKKKKKLSQG